MDFYAFFIYSYGGSNSATWQLLEGLRVHGANAASRTHSSPRRRGPNLSETRHENNETWIRKTRERHSSGYGSHNTGGRTAPNSLSPFRRALLQGCRAQGRARGRAHPPEGDTIYRGPGAGPAGPTPLNHGRPGIPAGEGPRGHRPDGRTARPGTVYGIRSGNIMIPFHHLKNGVRSTGKTGIAPDESLVIGTSTSSTGCNAFSRTWDLMRPKATIAQVFFTNFRVWSIPFFPAADTHFLLRFLLPWPLRRGVLLVEGRYIGPPAAPCSQSLASPHKRA